jgi:carbonic anhydrase
MSVTDELLANNAQYAANFQGALPMPPAKHVAVVACMDARINVYDVLGLNEGEAHVIRWRDHRGRDPIAGDQSAVARY